MLLTIISIILKLYAFLMNKNVITLRPRIACIACQLINYFKLLNKKNIIIIRTLYNAD